MAAVKSFGGQVVLTRRDHSSGTDRVAEVAQHLDVDVIINLQGDEPLVDPAALDLLPELLGQAEMATLAVPITSIQQWHNPNCVKVVCDAAGRALYFSRSPIPFAPAACVSRSLEACERETQAVPFLQHLGLYAYRRPFLLQLAAQPPQPLELLEKLEQLRALALGHRVQIGLVRQAAIGVDTYEDYMRFVHTYRRRPLRAAA